MQMDQHIFPNPARDEINIQLNHERGEVASIYISNIFGNTISYFPKRAGERYASVLTRMNLNNKIIRLSAKIKLKDYVSNFLSNNC